MSISILFSAATKAAEGEAGVGNPVTGTLDSADGGRPDGGSINGSGMATLPPALTGRAICAPYILGNTNAL